MDNSNAYYKHYKDSARKALEIYNKVMNISVESRQFYNRKSIKLKDVLNYFALKYGFKGWSNFKCFHDRLFIKICTLHKKWEEENNHKIFSGINKDYLDIRELYNIYSPGRVNFSNLKLGNFNFNIECFMGWDDAIFGGHFSWAKIINSTFRDSTFYNMSFCVSDFDNVCFSGCRFSSVPKSISNGHILYKDERVRTDFDHATLVNCDLSNTILCEAYARGANFFKSNFSNSILCGSNLFDADLRYCDFTNSNLMNADLRAKFSETNFCGANLLGATVRNIFTAFINNETIFPNGIKIHPDNNINMTSKKILLDQNEELDWLCLAGHKWKEGLKSFSVKLTCPHCPSVNKIGYNKINFNFKIKEPKFLLRDTVSSLLNQFM